MRTLSLLKLPLLLVLLLLSLMLLAAAASAHASILPLGGPSAARGAPADDEEGAADEEEGESEAEENEACEGEEEGEELCEEELEAEEDEACVVEEAGVSAAVTGNGHRVLLTIRYHSFEPTAVAIDARLRGSKGSLHLGDDRVRFRDEGTFRDSFSLGPKQFDKALAAREFDVDVHAVGTPADCDLRLATRGSRRAR